jgi:hypothetical protein
VANIARRPDGTWRARYRDDGGREHARHFDRKVDAQRWLDEVTATVVTGTYVDPKAGRATLAAFYALWAARQVWAPGTELAMSLAVRSASFRDVELRSLRRSHVEQWVKTMVRTASHLARCTPASRTCGRSCAAPCATASSPPTRARACRCPAVAAARRP